MSDEEEIKEAFKKDIDGLFKPEDAETLASFAADGVAEYHETGDPSALFSLKSLGGTQETVDAAIAMGGNLVRQGLLQKAAEWFTGLVHLEPLNAKVYMWCGLIAHKQRSYKEAIVAYRLSRSIDPDIAAVHLYLGECQLLIGEYEEGFESLRVGIEMSKDKPELAALRTRAAKFLSVQEKMKAPKPTP
jgi:tetratricopeptide (TPR) repeat protein